jgi:hypothetical protein
MLFATGQGGGHFRRLRAAAERVADEIRALPPVEEAVNMLSRSG